MRIQGIFGEWYDRVLVDGVPLPPGPSQRVVNHSPDGFAWGYGGSGPSQLALAILLRAGVDVKIAVRLHHVFVQDFIMRVPSDGNFDITVDVRAWVDAHKTEQERLEPLDPRD